jgi:hypothetical protein
MTDTCQPTQPNVKANLTIGGHVLSSFRLLDVLPFDVLYDISRLIYRYLHDPEAYAEWRKAALYPQHPKGDHLGPGVPLEQPRF